MKFGTFLLALVEPMLAKILLALGFSVVSILGVEATANALKQSFVTSFNSMPADWLQFGLYIGLGKGVGIIFGAITTKLALWAIQNATSLLGKNTG
jgi:cell division protein FtsX